MAVSKFTSASGGNDFNVNVGSTYSVVNFTQEYAAGAYSFTSAQLDITMDVYAYDGLGNLAGYTSGKGLITTSGFNKLIIIGGTVGDVLSFSYKTTYASVAETNEVTAGPVVLSASPTSLPNVNSTTVVTGLNFATDITASFKGSDNLVRAAKSVVRGSANSLVVTRPDALPTAQSPYSLTVINPSVVNQPTGSSANILTGFTSGSNPVWVTTILPPSLFNTSYSATLSATDADAGSSIVSYTIISGTLPTGLSLNTSTGAITGNPTGTGATTSTIVFRATDSGGEFTNKSLTFTHYGNTVTADATYYYQSFTANASYTPSVNLTADVLIVAGGGAGAGADGNQGLAGGGGAGGYIALTSQALTTAAAPYTITVGAGGTAIAGSNTITAACKGTNTVFSSTTAIGGGAGTHWWFGTNPDTLKNGGSGGGGGNQSSGAPGGSGTSGQGNNGGSGAPYNGSPGATSGGGGGGAGATGGNGSGATGGSGGVGLQWLNGTFYAGGGGGSGTSTPGSGGNGGGGAGRTGNGTAGVPGTPFTGGGGGGAGDAGGGGSPFGGNGGAGVVVLRYTRASVGG